MNKKKQLNHTNKPLRFIYLENLKEAGADYYTNKQCKLYVVPTGKRSRPYPVSVNIDCTSCNQELYFGFKRFKKEKSGRFIAIYECVRCNESNPEQYEFHSHPNRSEPKKIMGTGEKDKYIPPTPSNFIEDLGLMRVLKS